jgi:hypothetical protein
MFPKPITGKYQRKKIYCVISLNNTDVLTITKGQKVTITGQYKLFLNDPWLHDCKIVDQ